MSDQSYRPGPTPGSFYNERGELITSNQFDPLKRAWSLVTLEAEDFQSEALPYSSDNAYDVAARSKRSSVTGYGAYFPWGSFSGGSSVRAFLEPTPGDALIPVCEDTFIDCRIESPRIHLFGRHLGSVAATYSGVRFYVGAQPGMQPPRANMADCDFVIRQAITLTAGAAQVTNITNELGTVGGTPRPETDDSFIFDFCADRRIVYASIGLTTSGFSFSQCILVGESVVNESGTNSPINVILAGFSDGGALGGGFTDTVGSIPGVFGMQPGNGSAPALFPVRGDGFFFPLMLHSQLVGSGSVVAALTLHCRGRIPGFAPVRNYWRHARAG